MEAQAASSCWTSRGALKGSSFGGTTAYKLKRQPSCSVHMGRRQPGLVRVCSYHAPGSSTAGSLHSGSDRAKAVGEAAVGVPGAQSLSQGNTGAVRDNAKVVVRLHAVKAGETLSSISKEYGVAADAIKVLNKKQTSSVYADEILYLPSPVVAQGSQVEGDASLTVIHVTPRTRLMLRKVSAAESASAADVSTAAKRSEVVVVEQASNQKVAVFNTAKKPGLEGVRVMGGVHKAAPEKALFASVQASNPFSSAGLYGPASEVGDLAAGVLVGRGSMALGACLLLLGSGSVIRSTLQQHMRPEGLLFGMGSALQGMIGGGKEDPLAVDPGNRTARRYLKELKRGNVKISKSVRAAMKLGIPTGEEVLLRRRQGPRELVVGLRKRDGGLSEEEVQRHENQMYLATSATQNAQSMSGSESVEWSIDPMLEQPSAVGRAELMRLGSQEGELVRAMEGEAVASRGADFESMNVRMAKLANFKAALKPEQKDQKITP